MSHREEIRSRSLTTFEPLTPEPRSKTGGFFRKFFVGARDLERENEDETRKEEQQHSSFLPPRPPLSKSKGTTRNDERKASVAKSLSKSTSVTEKPKQLPSMKRRKSEQSVIAIPPRRTLQTVLSRIGKIVDLQGTKGESIRQYWMDDENCKSCYDCGNAFTTFRRRHHCRVCGQIFCSRCCWELVPGQWVNSAKDLRVCNYCAKIVKDCTQRKASLSEEAMVGERELKAASGSGDVVVPPATLAVRAISLADAVVTPVKSRPSFDAELNRRASVSSFSHHRPGIDSDLASLAVQAQLRQSALQYGTSAKKPTKMQSFDLYDIWKQLGKSENVLLTHRHRLRTYPNTMVASEIVDWLVSNRKASNRNHACIIGQALLDSKRIEHINGDVLFKDEYALYKPGVMGEIESEEQKAEESTKESQEDEAVPEWFRGISTVLEEQFDKVAESDGLPTPTPESPEKSFRQLNSSASLDFDNDEFFSQNQYRRESRSLSFSPSAKGELTDQEQRYLFTSLHGGRPDFLLPLGESLSLSEGQKSTTSPRGDNDEMERIAAERLQRAHQHHLELVLQQQLRGSNVDSVWFDVILNLAQEASMKVLPNHRENDEMDIRSYVQIKKVPGDSRNSSQYVSGVVFTKTLIHKKMASTLKHPRILLLRCALEYERVENKFSSIDTLVMQERSHTETLVRRIKNLRPDIVLVEKTASQISRRLLHHLNIALVVKVKPSVMQRLSRFTGATLVAAIDQLQFGATTLGTCDRFQLVTYDLPSGRKKTLMSFEGCPEHKGCTLILRGGSRAELIKVKKILKFVVMAAYNSRVEKQFHMDMQAVPPIFDTKAYQYVKSVLNSPPHLPSTNKALHPLEAVDDCKWPCSDEDSLLVRQILLSTRFTASGTDTVVEDIPWTIDELLSAERSCFLRCFVQVLLSTSPSLVFPLPYLETAKGRTCCVRRFLPSSIYWSKWFRPDSDEEVASPSKVVLVRPAIVTSADDDGSEDEVFKEPDRGEPHPFITGILNDRITSPANATALADFRARGGRVGRRLRTTSRRSLKLDLLGEDSDAVDGLTPGGPSMTQSDGNVLSGRIGERKSQESAAPFEPLIKRPVKYTNKLDCLNPASHQQLLVLFSSQAPASGNAPNPCISPRVLKMSFYKKDLALGAFLETHCFRLPYPCLVDNCGLDMNAHVRHFVHGRAVVRVELQEFKEPVTTGEKEIVCWTYCKRCKQTSTTNVLSSEAQAFSFVRYLELRMYGRQYHHRATNCSHSLHQDYIHCFGSGKTGAVFEHSTILLLEVVIPAIQVAVTTHGYESVDWLQELKLIHESFKTFYKAVEERLSDVSDSSSLPEESQDQLKVLKRQLQVEQEDVLRNVETVKAMASQRNLIPSTSNTKDDTFASKAKADFTEVVQVVDAMIQMKKACIERLNFWNRTFHEIHQTIQKNRKTPNNRVARSYGNGVSVLPMTKEPDVGSPKIQGSINVLTESVEARENTSEVVYRRFAKRQISDSDRRSDPVSMESSTTSEVSSRKEATLERGKVKRGGSTFFSRLLPESYQGIPSPYPLTEHYTLPLCPNLSVAVYDTEPSSIIAYTLSTREYSEQLKLIQHYDAIIIQATEAASVGSGAIDRRRSLSASPNFDEILASFRENHYTPSPTPDVGSSTPVGPHKEKEGFIRSFLNLFRGNDDSDGVGDGSRSHVGSEQASKEPSPDPEKTGDEMTGAKEEPDGLFRSTPVGPGVEEHATVDYNSETYKFFCRVYFAEKFRRLRELTFPAGEERFARSLSRCRLWSAKGGKSGSKFCKTFDDRLIIKQMSAPEMQSFMKFAPHYFDFVIKAHKNNKPTVIAKILGVYRVVYKNISANTSLKQDVLVMENLFYGRKISRIFDLKGSERNRYVQSTNQNDVLMDENLLKFVVESPLFIRPHAKKVLTRSILSDTEFLGKQLVMDYSLLVGIDDSRCELVVGIIDFIRTFTWDKRIEMWVKSSGILGGHGKMPTVVSPDVYRKRFCEAMDKYFLMVPDKWSGLGADIDWKSEDDD